MPEFNESIVEDAALEWPAELGSAIGHGLQLPPGEDLAPGEPPADRNIFVEVVRVGRLRGAIRRLNPVFPSRILVALRDTLLPKQLSGELRVASGEPILEAWA
jgi:hypothetical protein